MKIYLNKNVEKVGLAGEIVNVSDGFAKNFILPNKLGVEVTPENEQFYKQREKVVVQRKEVINSKTSMLANEIAELKLTLKRKLHDDGKLYGSVNAGEIVDLLAAKGVKITKSQVEMAKTIKAKGTFDVTIKLSSKLKPTLTLNIIAE
jgi:large subunit ribosomal protein L9